MRFRVINPARTSALMRQMLRCRGWVHWHTQAGIRYAVQDESQAKKLVRDTLRRKASA